MPLYSPATVASIDGWLSDLSTAWTYVSSTSFKVAGTDVTAIFSPGTRLRLKQGGSYKYFVVASSSFSTDTTVTITGGTDYTLANASITDNYYSYAANPQGYPGWFNYTPTATGFSSSSNLGAFSVTGRTVTYVYFIDGTSNATTLTFSIPIALQSPLSSFNINLSMSRDNGVQKTSPGRIVTGTAGSTSVTANLDITNSPWTSSGNKRCEGTLIYSI